MLDVVTTQSTQAQTFTVLYNFKGSLDGSRPFAGLVQDGAGNLYGTTEFGGTSNDGVVFKVDPSGNETVLYSFIGGTDGAYPFAPLVRDAAGDLYGTTCCGGTSGDGVVFKVSKTGKETILHSFTGGTTDGCNPYGGLLRDKTGTLYGTTDGCGAFGFGTVFKVSKARKENILHSFSGQLSDGAYPLYTSLLMDKDGDLYGVTEEGGTGCESHGCGVVYKLRKSGTETVLYSFTYRNGDGTYPIGSLSQDAKGDPYGTANGGGASGYGTVYKLSKSGAPTLLYSFTGGESDGGYPPAGVITDANGNLYGDTYTGGAFNSGTVYELSKGGTLTLLHSFNDGDYTYGGLIRDAKGNLYGTTNEGGGYGTVWKLTP
jgi:uncharacterized repeat protein (TIGR03803 family)